MRALGRSGFVLLCLLLLVPAAAADEGGDAPTAARVAEKALDALKIRLEARIKEGELLSKSGRVEEALEAYRSVGQLYEQGMALVREVSSRLAARPAPRPAARPEVVDEVPFTSPAPAPAPAPKVTQPQVSRAIEQALAWLAAHQSPSGGWEAAGFQQWCDGETLVPLSSHADGVGKALYDPGVTGLALCAFLGAGHTNRGKHPYAVVVNRGLRYLKNIQDPEGCFGPRSTQQYIYNHALCSLAMIEAFGMTNSPVFRASAQRALDFIALSRNPYFGWRYGIKPGDNDTSVTTWMVFALKSAQLINADAKKHGRPAPLQIDEQAFVGARAWIERVTDPAHGRTGYVARGSGPARPADQVDKFPASRSESMTAAAMLVRIFTGDKMETSDVLRRGAALVAKLPPVWNPDDGSIDMYYWYYGTLAMYQVGGAHWRHWNEALQRAVVANQRQDTDACSYEGSWDPVGPWGRDGGRVYSTALLCMALEASARYASATGAK
jgi:hypothetical protein